MQWIMGACVGIGLSATCGFRVFVPMLGMSIACKAGHLTLSHGFEWIASWPAIIAFSIAVIIEVCGYYIPWVDNFLDSIATPAAIVAGTIVTAAMVGDVSPFLRWSLAIIAGGGTAGVIQSSSVLVRGTSTATTGGAANPVVSTGELIASIIGTVLSIVLPVLAIIVIAFISFIIIRRFIRKRKKLLKDT
ncbi:MAG: DUF4126 domain-containing protein [Candidatus Theseobacter exili]|nr:DUF4126 domain-containing protein [Candidatus Theseobacter exili]